MQKSPARAEQWYADLESTVRLEMLTQALAACDQEGLDGEDPDDRESPDSPENVARVFLAEPALRTLPMRDFMLLTDFVEAGWEFCLGDLVAALDQGTTLRTHLTRLVARRLSGVVTHFGLDPAEILACLETERGAA